ncbi:MAG: acyl-CoA desaturase, partial [Rhodococcus sp. (in: high G+C Gram-positive bacteria)]
RTIARLAFPGGKARPKPGPYRSSADPTGEAAPSEAARFRRRMPSDHPAAGPEHEGGGVAVDPPPR